MTASSLKEKWRRFRKWLWVLPIPAAIAIGGLTDTTVTVKGGIRAVKVDKCEAYIYLTDGTTVKLDKSTYDSPTRLYMSPDTKESDIEAQTAKEIGRDSSQVNLTYDGDCITDINILNQ